MGIVFAARHWQHIPVVVSKPHLVRRGASQSESRAWAPVKLALLTVFRWPTERPRAWALCDAAESRRPRPPSIRCVCIVDRTVAGGLQVTSFVAHRSASCCARDFHPDSMTLVSWTRRRLRVDDAGQHEARDRLAQWRLKGPWQACKRACPFPSGVTSPLRQRAAAHRRRWEIRRAATPCPVQSRHAVESCMKSFAAYGIAGEAGESTLGWPGLPPAASLWASCVGRGPTAPRDDVLEGTPKRSDSLPLKVTTDRPTFTAHNCACQLSRGAPLLVVHASASDVLVCIRTSLLRTLTTPRNNPVPALSEHNSNKQPPNHPHREAAPSPVTPRPRQTLYFETPPARLRDLSER
jgi:hypothetical protein